MANDTTDNTLTESDDASAAEYAPGEEPEGHRVAGLLPRTWGIVGITVVVLVLIHLFNDGLTNGMLRESLNPQTAAVALAVIGLNVHFGLTGLLNMGQAGFMLLGAYGFAIAIRYDLSMTVAILIGLGGACLFALVLGLPTLKLRGDYLAIVTISAAEIIRFAGRSTTLVDYTGSAQGLAGNSYRDPFTSLSFFGSGTTTLGPLTYQNTGVNGWWVRAIAWTIVLLAALLVYLLARSPWGRTLRGIREDEDAVRSLGKNVFAIKMQALIIGGCIAAIGGMLYVLPASVQPDAMGKQLTFFCYTALLLGGAATIFGPILGSMIFFAGRIFVKSAANDYVPSSVMSTAQADQFAFMVVGLTLILLVVFRPQGILGNRKELQFDV